VGSFDFQKHKAGVRDLKVFPFKLISFSTSFQ
jgi:hypothetical protein